MVAFAESERDAQAIGDAMQDAFRNSAGLKSDVYLGPINREGARRLA